jgi:hypothetical protein
MLGQNDEVDRGAKDMNKSLLFHFSVSVVVLTGLGAPARAAQLNLHLQYDQSYKSDFSPAGYSLAELRPCDCDVVDPTDIHQFSILLELTGALASPEESLQGVLLDVMLGPGLAPYAPATYGAVFPNPTFDPPGPPPPVALWTTNEDSGPDDLLRIAGITSNTAAHGLDPGETSLAELGDFFVTWDTVAGPLTSLKLIPAAGTADPWALWVGALGVPQTPLNMAGSNNPNGPSGGFELLCPEPTSLTLAGLAALGLMGVVRRRGNSYATCFQ